MPLVFLILLLSLLALIFTFKRKEFPPLRISTNDTLSYLSIRQKLLSFPYDRLLRLKKGIGKNSAAGSLNRLLDRIMYEDQINNMLSFEEEIIIDNQPLLIETPFYEDAENKLSITNLKPYAEHLYFYNLKLGYRKNSLIKKNEALWINPRLVGKSEPLKPAEKAHRLDLKKIPREVSAGFSYRLRENNQSDFFFFLRQWFKKYEEGQIYPVIHGNSIIIRNEYRLFCIDMSDGEEKWSFGDLDNSGQEFYQTFRHPHQNSFGYEFLLDSGTVFTELDHKFIAVKVDNSPAPQLIWERDLGEYTVCAKPIKSGENIIVGLINARMELWICGFDQAGGGLKWSTYIGTSAFLSPVSSISLVEGARAYIGTNHGVLICLDTLNGEIVWLRKYAPKKYSIFDYVLKKHYEDSLSDKGFLRYDTQFMDLNKYGDICYKGRESDSFYILNPDNGSIKKEILIDPESYYLLRMHQDNLVFLGKDNDTPRLFELKIINAGSGKQIYKRPIKGESLKGVYYASNETTVFKIDRTVYFLSIFGEDAELIEIILPKDGWLLYADNKHLLLEDAGDLFWFNIGGKLSMEPRKPSGSPKEDFVKAVQSSAAGKDAGELRVKILSQIESNAAYLEEIMPVIINNSKLLQNPEWKGFFARLNEIYGSRVISLNDVEIRFSNFLKETGLIHSVVSEKKKRRENAGLKNYQVQGEKIEILPVKVIKGKTPLGFFLILNLDQLICVDEKGEIIWQRKVFYNNREYSYNDIVAHDTDINKGRIFAGDIEAYLFEGALIINDRVNIIAVNVSDGSYLWSMTNRGRVLEEEKIRFKHLGSFFRKYGYQASYLQNIFFDVVFIEDNIFVAHGNKIYSINPLTGVCGKPAILDVEGILQLYTRGKYIYVLPSSLDKITVLDNNLKTEKVLNLDFSGEKESYAELNFAAGNILVKTNSGLSIIGKDGKMGEGLWIGGGRFYAEGIGNNLLVIHPFSRVTCYNVGGGDFSRKWEFAPGPLSPETLWKGFSKKTKFYYIIGGKLIFIYKKGPHYLIAKLDLKTGKKEWESSLEGAQGVFYNLSDYQNINGAISFIITTACGEDCDKDLASLNYVNNVILDSNLFQVNLLSGKIMRKQRLQSMMNHDFGDIASVQTNNYFIYEVYSKFLSAEIKSK